MEAPPPADVTERYRTLIASIDQGFCVLEVLFDDKNEPCDLRFLEANAIFERQTGFAASIGRTVRELVPNIEEHWTKTYGRVALTGEAARFISESPALDRWFDVYAVRLGGEDSRQVAILFSDITARKRAEDDLRAAEASLREADRRKDEFLAVLAHELRNPLAPIRSGLQVLALAPHGEGRARKIREMMDRQLGHMVRLIDDLLDVARISRGKVELKRSRVDARTLVESAVEACRPLVEGARHTLHLRLPAESLPVHADSTRITQVVTNILNNAVKYTPDGGHISLTAERAGSSVLIRVTDDGIGIPPAMLPAVFEMFTQVDRTLERTQRGLGIGLSLARRLVEMHGGSVEGESGGPGTGSTFTVKLPLTDHASTRPPPIPRREQPHASLKVLIVDDNTDGAEMLAMYLELAGNRTRTAFDGRAALEAAREFNPEIVFLDIGLPDTNGYEVARRLRLDPASRSAVLVALTGWGSASDKQRADEAGFDAHLTKPVDVTAVKAILARFASGRTA